MSSPDTSIVAGIGSDKPCARTEDGRVGVAIGSLDTGCAVDTILVDRISTSPTIKAPAPILLGLHVATAADRTSRGPRAWRCAVRRPGGAVARVVVQALAVVLERPQSLHTRSFDEALALPTGHVLTPVLSP